MFELAERCSSIYKFPFLCQFVSQLSCCLSVQEDPFVSTRVICKPFSPLVLSIIYKIKAV